MAVSGNYAYVAAIEELLVLDVSDPARPRRVGGNTSFCPSGVAVAGEKVFAAAGAQCLVILHLDQPETIAFIRGD